MRIRKRSVGLVAIVVVIVSLVTAGLWTRDHASAANSTPDKIVYSQQNGKNGSYMQYVPGDGSKVTTESVTGAGGCATPNTTNPVLAFSAVQYPNGYSQPSISAIVGAFNNRTGVCAIPQTWSLEVGEGLIFAPGPNALTTARQFVRAQLQLEREDTKGGTLQGVAIPRNGTTAAGPPIPFSITTGQIPFDTQNVATGFDSIELRVTSPAAGSISVVGPTSTFTFATKWCPGDPSINATSTDGSSSSGQVSATIALLSTPNNVCKSYTSFVSTTLDPNSPDGKSVTFLSQQLAGAHIATTIDWGYGPLCRDDATPDPNVPPCPTTYIDFGNGAGPQPETYCAAADPNNTAAPWCVTSKRFEYVNDPGGSGATVAHEIETFDGFGDIWLRR
jgi:hypothetical protein